MSKILVYDIETTPNLAYVWGKWQQDVIDFLAEWQLLSFSYKWLGEKKTVFFGQDNFDEEALVKSMHELFDEADVVIAHNGDSFDQRMMNAKFAEYNLGPPVPYKSIDTKKVAKKYFRFTSNKLDDLGEKLGLGRKAQTGGFSLWLGCMNGDKSAWAKMRRYNLQDVKLLEKIYLKLRPWINNHPALNVLDNRPDACPKCGHNVLQSRGTKTTKVCRYRWFRCMGCGGWSSAREPERTNVKYTN